jgi:Ca2+-binding RTX toxin-like protein
VSGTKFFNIGPLGIAAGDLYRSGSWITPVAKAVRDKLINWGMPAAALNIVGNSLGAHLASNLAATFTKVGDQVGSVTALDPASNQAKRSSPYDTTNGFDTDLSNGYVLDQKGGIADPIKRLDIGATTSRRSFNGISSLAGNEAQAGTAKESFLFDFGTDPNDIGKQIAQHNGVVTAYTNLVKNNADGNSRLATNILGLKDTLADHQFRPNFYKGDFSVSPQVHEGVIPVDAQNNPLFLVAANAAGGLNDRIIYGTNGNDVLTGTGIFGKYYNNNGNHTYYLGDGNDIVTAGSGNDTIFGGAGDDTLNGGDGSNTIRGEGGNDYLTGGNGLNKFFGGSGNDTLVGGTGKNLFKGSDGNRGGIEVDTLIGNTKSSLNAFYIGDGITTNWYSTAGRNDYAKIVNFNPDNSVIIGGVNIEAQNLITQTFLWSGSELIAKIDGLWASQIPFPTRLF